MLPSNPPSPPPTILSFFFLKKGGLKERTSREVGLRSETREIVFCAFFTASDCGFPGRGMKHWLGLYNDQLDHGLVWGGVGAYIVGLCAEHATGSGLRSGGPARFAHVCGLAHSSGLTAARLYHHFSKPHFKTRLLLPRSSSCVLIRKSESPEPSVACA